MTIQEKANFWPADKVERWPIDELLPYARNTKIHSDEQVRQIAASIEKFGWTIPVLVDEAGELIAGHGRVMAAHLLGITEVPTMVAVGWSEAQKRAYRIADNKLAENAAWDLDALKVELADLGELNFDLGVVGFSDAEIDALLADQQHEGDGAAEAADAPKAKLAERFGIPPFSILNAREGWWQDRKRAWIALGIESELGRGDGADAHAIHAGRVGDRSGNDGGLASAVADAARRRAAKANAEPGGSKMPAANYSKTKARGDGRGRAVANG